MEIGSRLRRLRKEKCLSIAALSERSGVSTGLISQIERDIVSPTVVSIYRIAQALETDISYFFPAPNEKPYVLLHSGQRRHILLASGARDYELLTSGSPERALDMVLVTLRGGACFDRECVSHAGEECGYVISGTLTVLLDGREVDLFPGDSIHFPSTRPHVYINTHPEDCVSLWSMTPKFF
ncbi:putative Xre family DNA-binding protein [Oscillibacter valericigenes Sjm18-20]|nr:putative Xre family DNA-binding protein [Oscillibacter valericigenes Sjm18-20]